MNGVTWYSSFKKRQENLQAQENLGKPSLKELCLKKLGHNSKAYKNIFNGMYDKVEDPICRLCLNFVTDRSSCSDRYEEVHCWEENDFMLIPLCDKCSYNIHEEYDKNYDNYDSFLFAIGKKYYIDSWIRGNT